MFKKLIKFISKSILWILAFIVFVVLVAYFTANYWLVPVVNKFAPQITQTPTSLSSVDVSLLSGKLALKGLKIGNPEGFQAGDLFKLDEVSVQFQPKSVLTDKVIVDKVLIKGTQILAELNKVGQVNLIVLNQNIQDYVNKTPTQSVKSTTKTTAPKASSQPKTVVIRDLQILDSSIQLGFMGKKSTLQLPDIKEQNIGEKKKTSIPEAVMMIVNKLTVQPLEEVKKTGQKALNETLNYLSSKKGSSKAFQLLETSFSNLLK